MSHPPGKLAVILHADVAGSTALAQRDERLAHERIQATFRRFADTIDRYHGRVQELRGDALLAAFERSSDAVTAALAFQVDQTDHNAQLDDAIRPDVRIGISMGEVIVADGTVTGAGVVLAQRIEQLAAPGGLCVTGAIHESLPQRLPFDQESLGEQRIRGFDEPVRVYNVRLRDGAEVPQPAVLSGKNQTPVVRSVLFAVMAVLICGAALLVWYQPWTKRVEPASVERMALPLPDKPSIAVLPFENLSGDADQDFLVDGFTENIINSLARLPNLFVIARNSTFTYKSHPVKVQRVAEDLGVRYVLEGSFRRSGQKIRIAVQLIDALSGHHIWADTYDRDISDLFAIQDEITLRIVRELQVILTEGGVSTYERDAPNLEAYLLYWKARALLRNFNSEDMARARQLAERAFELDSSSASIAVLIGWTYQNDARFGWTDARAESYEKAGIMAQRALDFDPDFPGTYALLSNVYLVRRNFDKAIEAGEKSIKLAPSVADFYAITAVATYYGGDFERTVTLTKEAMRLHPFYPAWYEYRIGVAYRMLGRYEEALDALQKFYQRIPKPNLLVLTALASTYVMLGDLDQAHAILAETIELYPDASIDAVARMHFFKHPEHLERILDALREAGLPESSPSKSPM